MCMCVCVWGGGGGGGIAVTRFETTCLFESHDSPSDASEFLKSVMPSKPAQVTTDPGTYVPISNVNLGPTFCGCVTEVYYCTIGAQQGAQYREVPLY